MKWQELEFCPELPLLGGPDFINGVVEWFGKDNTPTHAHFYLKKEEARERWAELSTVIPPGIQTCSFEMSMADHEWIRAWNHSQDFLAWIRAVLDNQQLTLEV